MPAVSCLSVLDGVPRRQSPIRPDSRDPTARLGWAQTRHTAAAASVAEAWATSWTAASCRDSDRRFANRPYREGVPGAAAWIDFIASAIIEPTSETLAGSTSVFDSRARLPNCATYCSATRSCTAS